MHHHNMHKLNSTVMHIINKHKMHAAQPKIIIKNKNSEFWDVTPHAPFLTHSHMHTHPKAAATWRNHNAPRVPSPGNQKFQNSTPGSAKP